MQQNRVLYFLTKHSAFNNMAAIFTDDIFKCIFLNDNVWISIKISLQFVHKCQMNNIPALDPKWLGAGQATSHCQNRWWLVYCCLYAPLGISEFKIWWNVWCENNKDDNVVTTKQNKTVCILWDVLYLHLGTYKPIIDWYWNEIRHKVFPRVSDTMHSAVHLFL